MKGTILSSQTRAICRLMDNYGIDFHQELINAGLDPEMLTLPRSRFPFELVLSLWDKLPELTNNEAIGLEVGKYWRATDVHALGYSLIASKNLSYALNRYARYSVIINDLIKYKLIDTATTCGIETNKQTLGGSRVAQDMRWSSALAVTDSCLIKKIYPVKVTFTYDKPKDISPYTSFFQCDVEFNSRKQQLIFSREDAELEFTTEDHELAKINDGYLDEIIGSLKQNHIVDQLKKAIIDRLPNGTPSAQLIASDLSLSQRTLNRRLKELDTNYSKVLKGVRTELAIKYMTDSHLPITEVSYLLGFSDASSFSRAFKSWTGKQAQLIKYGKYG